ncbi:YeeE/YedE family protein [Achromobacter sp. Bel]|uniref:YeeE/YedE family protein n=1 Tax=Achromobacter sp. Bel TaxID=2727415 RepID=UPI00145F228A|nr:YeeE/YedE family protein [Achromobacter sp. Bel]NMK48430.1 YeeE/YedE family protein [Achromobacter sp. Bel]
MVALIAFASGLVFGLGLIVSGMANPAKVLGFLDIAGSWDPSLAFVMGGAVLVTAAGFAVLRRRRASLSGEPMRWPAATEIDLRLAAGSLAFGAGWGLAGFCPGPALVAASAGVTEALIFVAAMLVGMGVFSAFEHFNSR